MCLLVGFFLIYLVDPNGIGRNRTFFTWIFVVIPAAFLVAALAALRTRPAHADDKDIRSLGEPCSGLAAR
jgi:hypothetical protein